MHVFQQKPASCEFRRLLSNIEFVLGPLSFLSHAISHLLGMKYGIKRKPFLCSVHCFFVVELEYFLKGHGCIKDFNARLFCYVLSHVDQTEVRDCYPFLP